jgi:pyruvate,orthophosphate dikinase
MLGKPVTIRLLDPPLHEFLPTEENDIRELAREMGVSFAELRATVSDLHEINPMMGLRGCRLPVCYPEIGEMQTRAIIEPPHVQKETVRLLCPRS